MTLKISQGHLTPHEHVQRNTGYHHVQVFLLEELENVMVTVFTEKGHAIIVTAKSENM